MADFDFTLPAEVAASTPLPEEPNTEITDHADRAVNRLAEQYRLPLEQLGQGAAVQAEPVLGREAVQPGGQVGSVGHGRRVEVAGGVR
jgi:hypothetical protein